MKSDGTSWHPNANMSNTPWALSEMGKQYARNNIKFLPFNMDVNRANIDHLIPAEVKSKLPNKNKGKQGESLVTTLFALLQTTHHSDYISCQLTSSSQANPSLSNATCLLDNGALGRANFVSEEVASKLQRDGVKIKSINKSVASAFKNISIIN